MCHCGLFSMPLWSVSTLMRINVCASLRVSTHAFINSLFVKWIFTFPLSIQLATIEVHHPVSELPRIPFAGDTQFSCWHMGVFFWERSAQGFVNWHCSEKQRNLFCITCVEVIFCLRSDSGKGCAVTRAGNQKVVGSNVLYCLKFCGLYYIFYSIIYIRIYLYIHIYIYIYILPYNGKRP